MNFVVLVAFNPSPDYTEDKIAIMENMVRRHLAVDFEFMCLSNEKLPYATIPYNPQYKKWWMKLGMFAPGVLTGKTVLFIDLDMVITQSITNIFFAMEPFLMNQGFSGRKTQRDSSVMLFDGDDPILTEMYQTFQDKFSKIMVSYPTDQEYIEDFLTTKRNTGVVDYITRVTQDYIRVRSYKNDILKKGTPLSSCDIVSFHGHPKPWEVNVPWVQQHYK